VVALDVPMFVYMVVPSVMLLVSIVLRPPVLLYWLGWLALLLLVCLGVHMTYVRFDD